MLVYRDERRTLPTVGALDELRAELGPEHDATRARERLLAAFLRAGELECGIADTAGNARAAEQLTDELASAWLSQQSRSSAWHERVNGLIEALHAPPTLSSKPPEGYAYYGLTPDAYATLARAHEPASGVAVVVGVRSIGTTLSAAVCAVLRARGLRCVRFTVRPEGHPWDRNLTLTHDQRSLIELGVASDAEFFIVDEGPGMSGSTLLATAEAVCGAGVAQDRLTVYCGHAPSLENLRAPHARERWARLRVRSARTELRPAADDLTDLSAGAWRALVFRSPEVFPACWIEQERLKFLHASSARLYKFVGLPPYGRRAHAHAAALWGAGFSAGPLSYRDGFLCTRWVFGAPLTPRALTAELVDHMARYCAYRRRHFVLSDADGEALTEMAHVNVGERLGMRLPADFRLAVEAPVCVDGRMLPHEWIANAERPGPPVKADALDHGSGHLYPGPTDIRWDLAGAIVEWAMDDDQRRLLAERYANHAGAAATSEWSSGLADYVIAYAAFRVGCAEFALHSANEAERPRLERARGAYEGQLSRALRRRGYDLPERHMRHDGPGGAMTR